MGIHRQSIGILPKYLPFIMREIMRDVLNSTSSFVVRRHRGHKMCIMRELRETTPRNELPLMTISVFDNAGARLPVCLRV